MNMEAEEGADFYNCFETGGVGQRYFLHPQRKMMQWEETHALFSTFQHGAGLGRAWQAQFQPLALLSIKTF